MAARNEKIQCEFCKRLIARAEYRSHVKDCGLSEEEEEAEPVLKTCPLCQKQVKDLQEHCQRCTGGDKLVNNTYDNRHSSSNSSARQSPTTNGSSRTTTKKCPTCSERFDEDEFADHIDACTNGSSRRTRRAKSPKECPTCSEKIDADDFENHTEGCFSRPSRKPKAVAKSKQCPSCSEKIAEDDFVDHIEICAAGSSRKSKPVEKTKQCPVCLERFDLTVIRDHTDMCAKGKSQRRNVANNMKDCPVCHESIDEDEYTPHLENCATKLAQKKSKPVKKMKECPICNDEFNEDEFTDHRERCAKRRSKQEPKVGKKIKECPMCSGRFDEDDYQDHINVCGNGGSSKSSKRKNTKQCPTCSENIPSNDYEDHVADCRPRRSQKSTTSKDTEPCIICAREIPKADLQRHVNECLEGSSKGASGKRPNKSTSKSCFKCSSSVDESKNASHTIPCSRSGHLYCRKCLTNSMNEHIQANTPPVCQTTVCDYELSRYDIECLPIDQDIIQRLLPLVKTTRRPQCPFCHFYVEFNTMNDLQKHVGSCNPDNYMPCEYCHCLYNMNRLNEHTQQCRNMSGNERDKVLIDYIVPRTKYPVTAQQMRVFLEQRKKSRLSLDPHGIVDALAELDGAFPFDVPTRDCDICMEACLYDDIFVFGCEQSHKLCYGCFADSCKTKMTGNEILSCALCNYQLQDGEIKQLRIPAEEKEKYLDYQTQKTFGAYTGGQGVIKCPNQKCKWVVEAQNPNERFQVECHLCHTQFCSLCNRQYHFRTTCQQVPEITQRWFFWCNTERGNYWQARAQQDANFRAQLEDYQRQRAANEQRNQELQQRYNELLADEQFKAQSCRLCPQCGRVVQKLEGCDSMVCGRNYHGGDQQSGCGAAFKWSQATPYTPIGNTGPQQVRNDMPAPEQQKAVVHQGVTCDSCHKEVQGIRFDCIHCASLIYCEKCEQRATLEHSNQLRQKSKEQHVFQLITRPLQ